MSLRKFKLGSLADKQEAKAEIEKALGKVKKIKVGKLGKVKKIKIK